MNVTSEALPNFTTWNISLSEICGSGKTILLLFLIGSCKTVKTCNCSL